MSIYWNFEKSSRRTLDGGTNTLGGSHSAGTQYNPHTDNVIRFPALPSLPDDSRASERGLFIQDEMNSGVACALAVLAGFFAVAVGVGLYLGSLIFNLFDLG